MATVSSSPQSVAVNSKITVTASTYDPINGTYFTRSSAQGSGSVTCSVSVPAGSTINSATFSCTTTGGTLYGGTTKINGSTVSGGGPHYVGNGTASSITVSFSFKSNATSGYKGTPTSTYTQTRTFENCILTVDYTPPTAPSVWGVTLDGSAATQYRGSNAGLALNWSAQNGTNNGITSYSVHASDNGGAWYWWSSLSPGSAVTAHPTQGNSRKWLVTPVAPYGNGAGVESPTVYTYSYPTAPAISISPSSCYTGDPVTFSFSGASGGTGVSINSYSLYPGDSDSAIVEGITGSSYASTAPVEARTYTYRVRSIGSVPGYNSGYSNTVTLVVSPRQSSFTVNNASYPNLGQQLTATISPVNSGYTHKIKWQATNDPNNYNSGGYATVSAGVTTATFTPPLSWAKAEPSSPNTIGITVLLQTWNGASQVGTDAVISFSSNIPASVKPQNPSSSGATFVPNPALPAFGGVFLVGNSKLQATLSYSNNSYTNATSYTFVIYPPAPQSWYSSTVSTPTYTTANTLSMAGTYTIAAYATDARGRTSDMITVGSITVYGYNQPSFNITYLSREPVTNGTQFRINATVTVDKRNPPLSANAVSATHVFRAEWREKGATTWTTANITSGTAINLGSPNIALNKAYEVRVSAGDKVYETRLQSQIYTVPPVVRQFDFKNDRASLGKIASDTAKTFTLPDDWTTNINAAKLNGKADTEFLGVSAKAADSGKLDGKSAGNASGNIPISNGLLNVNLNAEFINGIPSSQLVYLPTSDHDHAGVRNLLARGIDGLTLQTSGPGEVYGHFPFAPYLIAGVSYVFSGWYKATANVDSVQFFAIGPVAYHWTLWSFTEWSYFEYTFIPSSTGNYSIRMDNNGSTNGQLATVWCKDVQLEQGSVATARTRSFGDGIPTLKCPYISYLGYMEDFYDTVVAFANLNQENSYTSGELLFTRPNGLLAPYRFLTANQTMYAQINMHSYHTTHGNTSINTLQKVKFNFHGVTYGGYRYSLQPQAMNVHWIGTGTHRPFMVVFRNTNSGAIYNAEVNSTLAAI